MELKNEFEVTVPLGDAWDILTDVERIAPCLPGAELREVDGDEYRGVVKVKLGPISAEYRGAARFVERNDVEHRAVLRAEGREARGQGNAKATITAVLDPLPEGTKVSVTTDLQITGKVAQFGRGVLADVSNNLLGQFVRNLEQTVIGEQNGSTTAPKSDTVEPAGVHATASPPQSVVSPPGQPVDLLRVAGTPVTRRIVPLAAATLLLLVLARFVSRSRARRGRRDNS